MAIEAEREGTMPGSKGGDNGIIKLNELGYVVQWEVWNFLWNSLAI